MDSLRQPPSIGAASTSRHDEHRHIDQVLADRLIQQIRSLKEFAFRFLCMSARDAKDINDRVVTELISRLLRAILVLVTALIFPAALLMNVAFRLI